MTKTKKITFNLLLTLASTSVIASVIGMAVYFLNSGNSGSAVSIPKIPIQSSDAREPSTNAEKGVQKMIVERSFSVMTRYKLSKEGRESWYESFGTTWLLSKSIEQTPDTYYFGTNIHVADTFSKGTASDREFFLGWNQNPDVRSLNRSDYVKISTPQIVFEAKSIERNKNTSGDEFSIDFAVFSLKLNELKRSYSRYISSNNSSQLIQRIKSASNQKLEIDDSKKPDYSDLSIAGFPASKVSGGMLAFRANYQIVTGRLEDQKSLKIDKYDSLAHDLVVNGLDIGGGSSGSLVLTREKKLFGLYWGGINEEYRNYGSMFKGHIIKLAVEGEYDLINGNNRSELNSKKINNQITFCAKVSNQAEICSAGK